MMNGMSISKAVEELWCVELVPKRRELDRAYIDRRLRWLAKGMPSDEIQALFWMAAVMTGLEDNREAHFVRKDRRLVVFKSKRDAAERARRETDEFWTGRVRVVKVSI